MKEKWINLKEALVICKHFPKAPATKQGLISAGKRGGFIRKAEDGFHWEYNKRQLTQYCQIMSMPTITDIAWRLNTTASKLRYLALVNGIKLTKRMNRKILTPRDARKLITIYTSTSHITTHGLKSNKINRARYTQVTVDGLKIYLA